MQADVREAPAGGGQPPGASQKIQDRSQQPSDVCPQGEKSGGKCRQIFILMFRIEQVVEIPCHFFLLFRVWFPFHIKKRSNYHFK